MQDVRFCSAGKLHLGNWCSFNHRGYIRQTQSTRSQLKSIVGSLIHSEDFGWSWWVHFLLLDLSWRCASGSEGAGMAVGHRGSHRGFRWDSSDLSWTLWFWALLKKLHAEQYGTYLIENDFNTLPMSQNLNVPQLNKHWWKMGRIVTLNTFCLSSNFFNFPVDPELLRTGASFWDLSIEDLSGIWQLWLRRPRLRSPDKTQFSASNRCKLPKNDAKKTGMYFDVSRCILISSRVDRFELFIGWSLISMQYASQSKSKQVLDLTGI